VLVVIAVLLLLFVLSPVVGAVVVGAAILFEGAEIVVWRRVLARYRIGAGPETMVGETELVVEPCDPTGTVRMRGEIWRARCESGASAGESVRILAINGLTLEVERAPG